MASKEYNYDFTEIAQADIDDTVDYIEQDLENPEAASAFVDKLEEMLEKICKAPKSGKLVENQFLRRTDVRKFLIHNYIAYYIVDEENGIVVILRIVYGKRDQDKILKNI